MVSQTVMSMGINESCFSQNKYNHVFIVQLFKHNYGGKINQTPTCDKTS